MKFKKDLKYRKMENELQQWEIKGLTPLRGRLTRAILFASK